MHSLDRSALASILISIDDREPSGFYFSRHLKFFPIVSSIFLKAYLSNVVNVKSLVDISFVPTNFCRVGIQYEFETLALVFRHLGEHCATL